MIRMPHLKESKDSERVFGLVTYWPAALNLYRHWSPLTGWPRRASRSSTTPLEGLNPGVYARLAPHVKDTTDNRHTRSWRLVCKTIHVPAEYWQGTWARENKGKYVSRKVFAFVPGRVPREDLWCFWNHEVDDFGSEAVCPHAQIPQKMPWLDVERGAPRG